MDFIRILDNCIEEGRLYSVNIIKPNMIDSILKQNYTKDRLLQKLNKMVIYSVDIDNYRIMINEKIMITLQ